MARFGFCGPTYASQSLNVDAERAINLYPEVVESSLGKSSYALYCTPGLNLFANLGSSAVLGLFACRPNGSLTDRLFAVVQSGINQVLYEVFSNGTTINRGMLNAPTTPVVTMKHNGIQLLICTGGQLWVMPFSTNIPALATGGSPPTNVEMVEYCDGFGIALIQNSNQFFVSALLDFTTWPALSTAQVSEFPDNVVSMIVNQRQIAFLGTKASIVYSNAGAVQQPFLPIQGVFVENGCCAPFATARLDNSVFWLDMDERGWAVARRANGYTPQRISNHSTETFWNSYPTVADAISYTYSEAGHAFWVIYFPSGIGADGIAGQGATWVYDVATSQWHERAFWNEAKGYFQAHHSQNHAFAFGKHFVGDRQSGNLYQQSTAFLSDAGASIRRVRRAPHISNENQWIYYNELQIDLETGLGPEPPLTGPSQYPLSYTIGDSKGNAYSLTCTDAGVLGVAATTGNIGVPVLLDVLGVNCWKLGVDPNLHTLIATLVPFDVLAPSSIPISTTPSSLQSYIFVEGGVIGVGNPITAPRDPQLFLRWSNDHGHTWTSTYTLDCGQDGNYKKRAVRRRLGRARTRTFEVSCVDPIPWRFVDAYLKAMGADEFKPTPRITHQVAKGA